MKRCFSIAVLANVLAIVARNVKLMTGADTNPLQSDIEWLFKEKRVWY